MSEFTWHLMSDGQPRHGKNDYLVAGLHGELYLASAYGSFGRDGADAPSFCLSGDHPRFLHADKVLAWAEVPPLGDGILRPCPFCGGKASLHRWSLRDGGYVEHCAQVRCDTIGCEASSYAVHECLSQDEVDEMAIGAWNRRASGPYSDGHDEPDDVAGPYELDEDNDIPLYELEGDIPF